MLRIAMSKLEFEKNGFIILKTSLFNNNLFKDILKKLLGILVLGLLLSANVYAKTINIEDKILLNVPENFSYIKLEADEAADYYEEFFSSLGDDANFYYIGTDDSIEFVNALINDQESVLEPIMKKMDSKNFSSEKQIIFDTATYLPIYMGKKALTQKSAIKGKFSRMSSHNIKKIKQYW